MVLLPQGSTLVPYTTLFRSRAARCAIRSTVETSDQCRSSMKMTTGRVREISSRNTVSSRMRRSADPDGICSGNRDSNRSEEHTSELQSHSDLVCRLLLEKKK